jgi:outer membrane protein OmpA-like peptidoglycan-associated protein
MTYELPSEALENAAWRKFIWIAGIISLLFHALLWFWFFHFTAGFGPPLVNPVDPARFNVKRADIDPKLLEPGGTITPGLSTPPTQRPIELDPDQLAAFPGSIQAPKIPTPRLTSEDPSPLSAAAALPSEGISALPMTEGGKTPQISQAMLSQASTAALPEASASLSATNLIGGGPGEGSAIGSGVPGIGDFNALIQAQAPDQPVIERPPFQPILIRLSSDVLFAFDSADLLPTATEPLQELAAALDRVIKAKITVEGHTDTIGDDAYNQRLSEARARTVVAWLQTHSQLAPDSYSARGFGKSRPIVNPLGNRDEQARNRRVEIRIEAER